MRTRVGVAAALAAAAVITSSSLVSGQSAAPLPLDSYVEALRRQTGIPGLSAAIVREEQIVWERGFGFQDVENSVRATPDTPYYIGELSQPFAAALLLGCVERGVVTLDDVVEAPVPPSAPGGAPGSAEATLRDLLAHASPAGAAQPFRYDVERFAALTTVIEGCTRFAYHNSLRENVLSRFAMLETVPGQDFEVPTDPLAQSGFPSETAARYAEVLARLAVPYKVDASGRPTRSEPPPKPVNASTGIISTVRDLARFDAALDTGALLLPETLELAWTNALTSAAAPLPTGLGWFVQQYQGERLVWHYSMVQDRYSALLIKIPAKRLTVILLANSDGLTKQSQLHLGDVTKSLFARLFLTLLL